MRYTKWNSVSHSAGGMKESCAGKDNKVMRKSLSAKLLKKALPSLVEDEVVSERDIPELQNLSKRRMAFRSLRR